MSLRHILDEQVKCRPLLDPRETGAEGGVEGLGAGPAAPALETALAAPPADDRPETAMTARRRLPDLSLDVGDSLNLARGFLRDLRQLLDLPERHPAHRIHDRAELGVPHLRLPRKPNEEVLTQNP